MRSRLVVTAVDSHTEGMPTRVVTSGVGELPGQTMAERRLYLMNERDDLRALLMHEPRGHSAMSGAILQQSTRPDADIGVVFIEVSGCLPMCGHGTIGTATVLVETGMVPVKEPVTVITARYAGRRCRGLGRSGRRAGQERHDPQRACLPAFAGRHSPRCRHR